MASPFRALAAADGLARADLLDLLDTAGTPAGFMALIDGLVRAAGQAHDPGALRFAARLAMGILAARSPGLFNGLAITLLDFLHNGPYDCDSALCNDVLFARLGRGYRRLLTSHLIPRATPLSAGDGPVVMVVPILPSPINAIGRLTVTFGRALAEWSGQPVAVVHTDSLPHVQDRIPFTAYRARRDPDLTPGTAAPVGYEGLTIQSWPRGPFDPRRLLAQYDWLN